MTAHVSFSQFDTYSRCGKRYQLERIQSAPRSPSVWLLAGKVVHTFIEQINLGKYPLFDGANARSVADLAGLMAADWVGEYDQTEAEMVEQYGIPSAQWRCGGRKTNDKPKGEDVDWWRQAGLLQCAQYGHWLATSGWRMFQLGEQIMAETNVTGHFEGLEVKAYLDSLMVNPDGELIIVDYKTGTKVPLPIQLGNYRALLMQTADLTVDFGAFYMTRKGEMSEQFDLRRFDPALVSHMMTEFDRARSIGLFLPSPGDACHICDVREACYVMGGAVAYQYDPLHPQYVPPTQTDEGASA